jgi:hypothetical protein
MDFWNLFPGLKFVRKWEKKIVRADMKVLVIHGIAYIMANIMPFI